MNDSVCFLKHAAALIAALALPLAAQASTLENFSDLSLEQNGRWNGSDGAGYFESDGTVFYNAYNSTYGSWSGFSYSNRTDTSLSGLSAQYTSVTGGGVEAGSVNNPGGIYAVGCQSSYDEQQTGLPSVMLELTAQQDQSLEGVYVTNSLYAYTSMENGDTYAKKFGGETGDDADWFKLTIHGLDENMESTGDVEVYLADFRFDDNTQDYILDDWLFADLSSLGDDTRFLSFSLDSSDVGEWGMNTPAYFVLGGSQYSAIPEPATLAWVIPAMALILLRRKHA